MDNFIHKINLIVLSIPKTVIFNLHYFPIKDAIKFPIFVSHRVAFQCLKGEITIKNKLKTGMIRLGYHENPAFDRKRERMVWHVTGKVIFNGNAYIGNGNKLAVTGVLECGKDFQMSGNSQIVCKENILFGNDILIGWDCLFMDGDAHKVYAIDDSITRLNPNRPINVGDRVWFGTRCLILKGTKISNDTVVAANTCISKPFSESNIILGGYPCKIIKNRIVWAK